MTVSYRRWGQPICTHWLGHMGDLDDFGEANSLSPLPGLEPGTVAYSLYWLHYSGSWTTHLPWGLALPGTLVHRIPHRDIQTKILYAFAHHQSAACNAHLILLYLITIMTFRLAKLHRETLLHLNMQCSEFWLCWSSVGFNIESCNKLQDLYCHSRMSG